MKFHRLFLALIAIMFTTSTALATIYKGRCGQNATYTLNTETGLLQIQGTGAMYDYYDDDSSPWMRNNTNTTVKVIEISDGITRIGDYAFFYCVNLQSVTIPNSVTSIGDWAFVNCDFLANVTIPNSVTSIGDMAFGCNGLTSITIPSSVTSIDDDAFNGCIFTKDNFINNSAIEGTFGATLCDVEQADGLMIDGDVAIFCRRWATDVTIPNSVTSIGNSAFYHCTSLSSITIPNSVTSIGYCAFYECYGLTSITIPNSVTSIGDFAFNYCFSLSQPLYNDKVFCRMPYSFSGEYCIPDGVVSIAGGAFYECSGLTSIIIPNSVTSIGDWAFYKCTGLKEVKSLAITPPFCGGSIFYGVFYGVNVQECKLKVPGQSKDAYSKAEGWKEFLNIAALSACKSPSISIIDGKLVVESATENAICETTITCADALSSSNREIELSGIYYITAYAHKDGIENSEPATAVLVWVNPSLYDDLDDSVLSMEAKKALLLRSNGDHIVVCGTEAGELLELYTLDGMALDKVRADDKETRLGNALQKGQTYIVRVGDRSVKFRF